METANAEEGNEKRIGKRVSKQASKQAFCFCFEERWVKGVASDMRTLGNGLKVGR